MLNVKNNNVFLLTRKRVPPSSEGFEVFEHVEHTYFHFLLTSNVQTRSCILNHNDILNKYIMYMYNYYSCHGYGVRLMWLKNNTFVANQQQYII